MVASHAGRKRPALSTVGRGTRGLLGFWDGDTPVVIAGTAIARTENRLHVLRLNKEENVITPLSTIPVPAEVWSLDTVDHGNQETEVIVAARRGCESTVEVWRLGGLPDLQHFSSDQLHQSSGQVNVQAASSSSLKVEGEILKVCKNVFNPITCLSLTQSSASTLDVSQSLKQNTSLSVSGGQFSSEGSHLKLVSADWIDPNTALIASQKTLAVFDTRTGTISGSLNVKKILEASKPGSNGFWVPPHPSRLASACSNGAYVVYAGSQDGWIRAFDVRANVVNWEAQHASHQWVSALCHVRGMGIVSGGTDGVVRCWTREGAPMATFPQHDDTVTNISCSADSFATVSYDGRIAVNEMPAGG